MFNVLEFFGNLPYAVQFQRIFLAKQVKQLSLRNFELFADV